MRESVPCHLVLKDSHLPIAINLDKFDVPEQRYCPAGAYEVVKLLLCLVALSRLATASSFYGIPAFGMTWVAHDAVNQ